MVLKTFRYYAVTPWFSKIRIPRLASIVAYPGTNTTAVASRSTHVHYPVSARLFHFLPSHRYIHTANNSMTPTNPALILVTLLFGLAGLFELLVLDEDEPVPVLPEEPVFVPVGIEVTYVEP